MNLHIRDSLEFHLSAVGINVTSFDVRFVDRNNQSYGH
jgi:hypothetical protein